MPATPQELEHVQALGETLKDEHVADGLIRILEREKDLLDSDIGRDPELREITVHNMCVLAAAAARIKARSA